MCLTSTTISKTAIIDHRFVVLRKEGIKLKLADLSQNPVIHSCSVNLFSELI